WSFGWSGGRRHTTFPRDWSSEVCSSDLPGPAGEGRVLASAGRPARPGRLTGARRPVGARRYRAPTAAGSAAAGGERAVGGEGEGREALADAAVGGGVGVQSVGQRQLGGVGLAVEPESVEVVQVRVVGRPLPHD